MFNSGMVEIPRLEAKKGSVMPVKNRHPGLCSVQVQSRLDSGFRRNDENGSRLLSRQIQNPSV
jgi:hypothetical protein